MQIMYVFFSLLLLQMPAQPSNAIKKDKKSATCENGRFCFNVISIMFQFFLFKTLLNNNWLNSTPYNTNVIKNEKNRRCYAKPLTDI